MRKKVDERIRNLIENGVRMRHRSMFVIIGDKSRDQIVNLHYLLSKAAIKSRPTVLWCYKDKLELSSHKKKRAKQVKKLMQRGLLDPEKADPFSLFIESERVSYCLYRDSDRILGNTYGMCILQDFEALTPNILARSIETVEGGGLVVFLLCSLSSLSSLFTMVMDVHERFRTEAHHDIVSRFNERFVLSLAACKSCLVMDDELNILPISSHVKSMNTSSNKEGQSVSVEGQELLNMKDQLHDVFPVSPLVGICTTLDQMKAVLTFLDVLLDKTLQTTIALTAARGRGKSASLGLAIAGAVAVGYSNIFVTAPSPQNLSSLFEFVQRGLRVLKYEEHLHYDILRSDTSDSRKIIVQVNIYKQHRQTVQYVQPYDHQKLSQVELLVIDEAAAIPLPVIKSLLGPYLVFLSSTVNGYEGTGRSLSLKLRSHLEKNSQISAARKTDSHSVRQFQKMELKESIRYAAGDLIETWLNNLLCLDATSSVPPISRFCHPSECKLYYVNRDTLFSFHKESEIFLQQIMSLFVASHYKNSPNDLQLMADAPAHHLFVLLGPVDESKNILPDIFCAIQVCLEGQISRDSAMKWLQKGRLPSGDQIPWKFCEEFEDAGFPSLSGARVVRIAVHPSALAHGYGSAALDQLTRYYEGQLSHISEIDIGTKEKIMLPAKVTEAAEKVSLLEEKISPRENLPPLLVHLQERLPEKVDYIGASFGLTGDLFRFWKKHKFVPFYICDTPNNMTGEHSCMVLKPLETNEVEGSSVCSPGFLHPFHLRFRQRFMRRLPLCFQEMDYKLAMSILDPKINYLDHEPSMSSNPESSMLMKLIISADDLKLLEAYANNCKEYTKIRDMVPVLARCYFQEQLPVTLSYLQACVLLCMGLQLHDVTYIERKMNIERQQVLSLCRKVMARFYKYLYQVLTEEFQTRFAKPKEIELLPHDISMEEDLEDGAKRVREKMNQEDVDFLDPKSHLLQQYSVVDREADFEHALRSCTTVYPGRLLSVKSNANRNGKVGSKRKAGETKKRKGVTSLGPKYIQWPADEIKLLD